MSVLTIGKNDLATLCPELAKEWHPTKNGDLTPGTVAAWSKKKVWWLLPYDDPITGKHFDFEWEATVGSRTRGNGCPYFNGKKIMTGFNDLATTHPELAKEWHPTKNGDLTPETIAAGSNKKVWWLLPYDDPATGKHFDFEWEAVVNDRLSGIGCPYLSGKRIMKGFNDLATLYPELAKEWHPTKNGNLTPETISPGSGKNAWWILPYDDPITGKHFAFEWEATVSNRVSGMGCPYLSGRKIMVGFNDLQTSNPEIASEWNYDKNGDLTPQMVTYGSPKKVWWKCACGYEWQASPNTRTNRLSGCPVCGKIKRSNTRNSQLIQQGNPTVMDDSRLLSEWNYQKNIGIDPKDVLLSSGKKIWWRCNKGHEWQAVVYSRAQGRECPYCGGKRLLTGINDFETWCIANNRQDILLSYDYSNNPPPSEVRKGTHEKMHWICNECGEPYMRSPHDINTDSSNGCPKCHRKIIAKKRHEAAVLKNNFGDQYPEIAKEWDYEKNSCTPNEVSAGSNEQFYWLCSKCGTSYKTTIRNRIIGTQCPRCSLASHTSFPEQCLYYYISQYYQDSISSDKHIGMELDVYIPSLNIGLEYDGVIWHKGKKKAKLDEEKEALCKEFAVKLIRVREKGLPNIKYNDTTTVYFVTSGDTYELENAIAKIIKDITGESVYVDIDKDKKDILAKYMTAKKANSLAEKYPEIAEEWDYKNNAPLTPDNIDYGSGYEAWWICNKCGFGYQTTVNARTCKKSGCPACSNLVLYKGSNDFVTWCNKHEKQYLLSEWDYEENGKEGIIPDEIVNRGGNVVAHWNCPRGHKYKALIYNRTAGKGCPICKVENHQIRCMNVDTGKVYNSLKEAGQDCGIQSSKISEVCKGKRKTAGGYHWIYYQ